MAVEDPLSGGAQGAAAGQVAPADQAAPEGHIAPVGQVTPARQVAPAGSGRQPRKNLLVIASGLALAALVIVALTLGGGLGGTTGKSQPPVAASSFSLPALGHAGGQVSLAAYAGRPAVINFFASYCGPCKRETPMLAKFYRDHHGRVLIIGIDSLDETAAALRFTRAAGLSYPVGVDASGSVATSYGIIAVPQTFMLNARHQIVRHIVGEVTPGELLAWARSLAGGKG
jgi:thiol-disulfide isomerase/thioredoxin